MASTESPTRTRFFNGQFLTEEDFKTEQNYHIGMRRKHNQGLHTAGVVEGLVVTIDPSSGNVIVAPGWGLDGEGRELVVPDQLEKDLTGSDGDYFVGIRFDETKQSSQDQSESGSETRCMESCVIEFVLQGQGSMDNGLLILARVTKSPGTVTRASDYTPKTAGAVIGDHDGNQMLVKQVTVGKDSNANQSVLTNDSLTIGQTSGGQPRSVLTNDSLQTGNVTAQRFFGLGAAKQICYCHVADEKLGYDTLTSNDCDLMMQTPGLRVTPLEKKGTYKITWCDPEIGNSHKPVILCNSYHGFPVQVTGIDACWVTIKIYIPGSSANAVAGYYETGKGVWDSFFLVVF